MTTEQNTAARTEDWKREICEVFFARSGIIIGVAVLIFACSVAVVFLWPPTFQASGSILLRGKEPQGVGPGTLEQTQVRTFPVSPEDLASEEEIIKSSGLIRRAVERLQGKAQGKGRPDDKVLAQMRRIKASLHTVPVLSSTVIKVVLRDKDGDRAEKELDAIFAEYIPYRSEIFNPANEEPFFAERAEMYKKKLERIEDRLMQEAKIGSVASVEREMESNIDLKAQLAERLNTLRAEYMRSHFKANDELEAEMKLLSMEVMDLEDRNGELQSKAIKIGRIMREADLLQYSYETFSRRAEESRINSATAQSSLSGQVSLLGGGTSSSEKVFPKRLLTLVLGLLVGIICGSSLGFVAEFLDHTFKKPADVARYAGLPVICSIKKL
ncbi:MAG: hypothetical protein HQ559_12080 [Lentisphaerae bacterium]|nr:hypothetical protein [Lentisphaerota bacterium]